MMDRALDFAGRLEKDKLYPVRSLALAYQELYGVGFRDAVKAIESMHSKGWLRIGLKTIYQIKSYKVNYDKVLSKTMEEYLKGRK